MIKGSFTYNRKKVAIVFLVLFSLFIFTPTIVSMVKSQVDVSVFYSVVEEEENTESKENSKTAKEMFVKRLQNWDAAISFSSEKSNIDFHREKRYAFVMADQFCPPPEFS